jgi:hypothetical protein
MTTLPDMTVEERVSTTAHGVPAPSTDVNKQLEMAIELNHIAKGRLWTPRVPEILQDYSPLTLPSAGECQKAVLRVTGYGTWGELSRFVVDDMCLDFFNLALAYCLRTGQPHKQNLGFIDGSGIGYVKVYTDRLKVTLEQAFDVKYFYKKARPLAYALTMGMDLTNVANAIHPGHWAYCAGHGTKFLTAVEVLDTVFDMSQDCYDELLLVATLGSHGRSGSLIHYPEDNCASEVFINLR